MAPRWAGTSVSQNHSSTRMRRGVAVKSDQVACTSVWHPRAHWSRGSANGARAGARWWAPRLHQKCTARARSTFAATSSKNGCCMAST